MDASDTFGEILERGQTAVSDFAKTAKGQIAGSPNQQTSQAQKMSDDQAKQFLSDLYGPTRPDAEDDKQTKTPKQNPVIKQNPVSQAIGVTPNDSNKGKSPEELAGIESLRHQLHSDYYQNLVSPPKQNEEHATEKLEREDQEEKMKEIEDEKKKPDELPITVKRGTNERIPGVSG